MNPSAQALQATFGNAIGRVIDARGETIVFVSPAQVRDVLVWLKQTAGQDYNYLVDVTAVEYRDRERPLEVGLESPGRSPRDRTFASRSSSIPAGSWRSPRWWTCGPAPIGWSARSTTCSAITFTGRTRTSAAF